MPIFGTKLHPPQLPVRKMPHFGTGLPGRPLLVQKDTLFGAGMPGKQLFGAGNQMICSRNFLLP